MPNNPVKGTLRAINDKVIVGDMDFGENVTPFGIVVPSDDGKTRGVHPRWAKVYKKGPTNTDEYEINNWVLIEHGRWTRGFMYNDGEREHMLRMVDPSAILLVSDTKPTDMMLGEEYSNGDTFSPGQFTDYAKSV